MRRTALLGLAFLLPGCTGTGEFLRHVHSPPPANPNAPSADSLNLRRALGATLEPEPLQAEAGNVWPEQQPQQRQVPTLVDLQQDPTGRGDGSGRQPRPRGSSTPPGTPEAPPPLPRPGVPPPPPSATSPRDPTGSVVQTPGGPGVDAGGTGSYRQLLTPRGPGAIVVPNGNGTSTVINPDGSVQIIPTPR